MSKLLRGLSLFCAYVIIMISGVPVCAEEKKVDSVSTRKIAFLARQADSSLLSEKQSNALWAKLGDLTPDEVLVFKKAWRKEQISKGNVTQLEAKSFPAMEMIDVIVSKKIQEMYGDGATIFNISSNDLFEIENDLVSDDIFIDLMNSVETAMLASSPSAPDLGILPTASCYYDNNWPEWMKSTDNKGDTYKSGGSGRVKNDPNESPCDFVLYIPAKKYRKVTGATVFARCIVNHDEGLAASPSKDAVIIGYWRCVACGLSASESYLRNNILFKKK